MDSTQTKALTRKAKKEPKEVFVQTSMRLPASFINDVNEHRWLNRKPSFTKALIELAQIGLQYQNQAH